MIVFTGGGSIAGTFGQFYKSSTFSFRKLNDVQITDILNNTEVLIHNAANLHPLSLDESIDDNFSLTKRIVGLVNQVNPRIKFIYLSSMSILKDEDHYKEIGEMNYYSFGKYLSELYAIQSNLASIVRFSTLFYGDNGKDGLSKMIFGAVRKKEIELIDEGISKRDFIPIEIACEYLNKICKGELKERIINVASGKCISFSELALFIAGYLKGVKITSSPSHRNNSVLSQFSTDRLAHLGKINFELESFVMEYIGKLQLDE